MPNRRINQTDFYIDIFFNFYCYFWKFSFVKSVSLNLVIIYFFLLLLSPCIKSVNL